MKGKVAFVLGAAVGYVLGTRAGRERYEQIKRSTKAAWESAPVQQGVEAMQGLVGDQLETLKTRAYSLLGNAFAARGRAGSASGSPGSSGSSSPSGSSGSGAARGNGAASKSSTESTGSGGGK